jgi:hypothetical protein
MAALASEVIKPGRPGPRPTTVTWPNVTTG